MAGSSSTLRRMRGSCFLARVATRLVDGGAVECQGCPGAEAAWLWRFECLAGVATTLRAAE